MIGAAPGRSRPRSRFIGGSEASSPIRRSGARPRDRQKPPFQPISGIVSTTSKVLLTRKVRP